MVFFAFLGAKTGGLEISYNSSDPSGPVEQRREYADRLRQLARGDGLSFVTGEVDFPFYDFSNGYLSSKPNHHLLITSEDENRSYSVATDAQGRFEIGPVPPESYRIDANTDLQFRDGVPLSGADKEANGGSFVRIELAVNSEINGRVILPEGYKVTSPFYVEADTLDGKQEYRPSIGDDLSFSVTGFDSGSYIVRLVNPEGEWLKLPVLAPGVTNKSAALRIDLRWAEHRTGLEIRVPPEALKGSH